MESSNDTDVFFMESEYETDDNSSEQESGYYTPPNSPQEQDENSLLTDDNNSMLSEEGNTDIMPALSSDTESDSDDDGDVFEDDDDVPWTINLISKLDRKGSEDLPGCPGIVAEDEEPQDITSAEHQDCMQRIFEEISEVMDAQAAERAAKEATHL